MPSIRSVDAIAADEAVSHRQTEAKEGVVMMVMMSEEGMVMVVVVVVMILHLHQIAVARAGARQTGLVQGL